MASERFPVCRKIISPFYGPRRGLLFVSKY
jgi:hypothetical protein